MQTFLPYSDFVRSAKVLDRQRLGKQRVECLQLLNVNVLVLQGAEPKGWASHPAALMWRGYEGSLLDYTTAVCREWVSRGYADTCMDKAMDLYAQSGFPSDERPPWLGNLRLHRSHQSNLIRKDPDFYRPLFPKTPANLPYYWPVTKDSK